MRWLDLFKKSAPFALPAGLRIPSRERLIFHVARFRRAIDQCSNPARLPELHKWLDYYEGLLKHIDEKGN